MFEILLHVHFCDTNKNGGVQQTYRCKVLQLFWEFSEIDLSFTIIGVVQCGYLVTLTPVSQSHGSLGWGILTPRQQKLNQFPVSFYDAVPHILMRSPLTGDSFHPLDQPCTRFNTVVYFSLSVSYFYFTESRIFLFTKRRSLLDLRLTHPVISGFSRKQNWRENDVRII